MGLHPVRTADEAKRRGAKGGKSRSAAKKFIHRKRCNEKCPYYTHCPFISKSQTNPGKTCEVKSWKREGQNFFTNLFEKGEPGLIDNAKDLLMRLFDSTTQKKHLTPENLKRTIDATVKVKDSIYGQKHFLDVPVTSGQIKTIKITTQTRKDKPA